MAALCRVAGQRAFRGRRIGWTHEAAAAHLLANPYGDALGVRASSPPPFTLTRFPAYAKVSTAKGCGAWLMFRVGQYGFAIWPRSWKKTSVGFHTENRVEVRAPQRKSVGVPKGRITAGAVGRFALAAYGRKMAQEISHEYCCVIQRNEGWQYDQKPVSA